MGTRKYWNAKEMKKVCDVTSNGDSDKARVCTIHNEFSQAFDFLSSHSAHDLSVTFFGSARLHEGDKYYAKAERIAERIVKECKYSVVTGGGPGIMEAANRGAFNASGTSVGFTVVLPNEQKTNQYVTEELPFNYFFSRKVALSFSAEAYLFFPGGFGTMDEFFEMITLVQTKKIKPIPIICVGKKFWRPLDKLIRRHLRDKFKTISQEDPSLYTILDDEDKIIEIIKNAPKNTDFYT